jgi:peptide-methionine (S)-S-oxide reductase
MSIFSSASKTQLPTAESALPGREQAMAVPAAHYVNGNPLKGPFAAPLRQALFGMGCFWGVERKFWQLDGVYSTFVGYAGGYTPNATYEEVCSGRTGHTETVVVVYDPEVISYDRLLQTFWEEHDPTQGMRQGNDVGSQYRSAIFLTDDSQRAAVEASRALFQERLTAAGYGEITSDVEPLDLATGFFYAEPYHQQYLAKNPNGYCGVGGTGVSCPIGLTT